MRQQEIRMLRCIGGIDNELILEADTARFRSRKWAHLAALAACLAVAAAVPFLLPKTKSPESAPAQVVGQTADGENKEYASKFTESQEDAAAAAPESAGEGDGLALGGLVPGMAEADVQSLLGAPAKVTEDEDGSLYRWLYNDLTVVFSGFSHRVWEVRAFPGSGLSLSNGIGFDSSTEQVDSAFHHAIVLDGSLDVDKCDTIYSLNLTDGYLTVELTNDTVSAIELGDGGDPLLEALTANPITLYTMNEKAGWDAVSVIDKAAKRICATMTISEPEPVKEFPATTPYRMIDFGTGVFGILHDDDIVTLYTYDAPLVFTTNEQLHSQLTKYLTGRYTGIDDAVTQALENPGETW